MRSIVTRGLPLVLGTSGCGPALEAETGAMPVVVIEAPSSEGGMSTDDERAAEASTDAEPALEPTLVGPEGRPCTPKMQSRLDALLRASAGGHLGAGMSPDGASACGEVAPGEIVVARATLQPGRCYTFVAIGTPSEVDLVMKIDVTAAYPALAQLASTPLAIGSTSGSIDAIGGGQACFKYTLPIPAPVVLVSSARTARGAILVQGYSR